METTQGLVRFISDLFQRLHEINVLEKTGNEGKANAAVESLNIDLEGSHMRCWWNNDSEEWVIQDTLLYGREDQEEG